MNKTREDFVTALEFSGYLDSGKTFSNRQQYVEGTKAQAEWAKGWDTGRAEIDAQYVPQPEPEFVDTEAKFDDCYECSTPMTPHEGHGRLLPGQITEEDEVWVRCPNGCRGGFRSTEFIERLVK